MPPELPGVRYCPANWTTFIHKIEIDYYDGPQAFLKRDDKGQHYLALWNDTYRDIQRWLHIPLDPTELRDVLTGGTPIRTTIENAEFFYVSDEDKDGSFTKTTMTWCKESIPGFNMQVAARHPHLHRVPETRSKLSQPPRPHHGFRQRDHRITRQEPREHPHICNPLQYPDPLGAHS